MQDAGETTSSTDGAVMSITIVKPPESIPDFSDAEIYALQEVVGLAENLAMRGDERAGAALEWARDLLAMERKITKDR
tara:strand:+ start:2700 stop:2933 length:234 start_codon:yes stop_codon:yes gene_type:complete